MYVTLGRKDEVKRKGGDRRGSARGATRSGARVKKSIRKARGDGYRVGMLAGRRSARALRVRRLLSGFAFSGVSWVMALLHVGPGIAMREEFVEAARRGRDACV